MNLEVMNMKSEFKPNSPSNGYDVDIGKFKNTAIGKKDPITDLEIFGSRSML